MTKRRALASMLMVSVPLAFISVAATNKVGPQSESTQLRGRAIDKNLDHNSDDSRLLQMNNKSCLSNVWHIDFTKMSGSWCTNALGYPDSFKDDPKMLQPSAEECCANLFPGKSCQVNKVCEVEKTSDADEGEPSSPSGTVPKTARPSSKPSFKPSSKLTKALVYYYLIPSNGLCSPIDDNTPSWMSQKDYFTDFTECCKSGWKFNRCMEQAPEGAVEVTTTELEVLYYSIASSGLCSVVDEKTPSWLTEKDFFTDWSQCCHAGWKYEECMSEAPPGSIKERTPGPTRGPLSEPTAHPTAAPTAVPDPTMRPSLHPITDKPVSTTPTKSPVGIDNYVSSCENAGRWRHTSDFSQCTNDPTYDGSWETYEKLSDCCAYFTAWGRECKYRDICTLSPTKSPSTGKPSKQPATTSPTLKPTTTAPSSRPNTVPPTESPSAHPTVTPIKYYIVFSTGICTPLDAFTPYWLKEEDFFLEYNACCEKSWNTDACLAVSPTQQPTTLKPSLQPTSLPTSLVPTSPLTSRPSLRPSSAAPTKHPMMPNPTEAAMSSLSNLVGSIQENKACDSASIYWHPSEDYSKCTNSLAYPDIWDEEPFKSSFLLGTKEACCQVFYESWGLECKSVDVCDVSSCDKSALWHPSSDYSACSNRKFGYDDSWNHPPLKSFYMKPTLKECCYSFFEAWGKDCIVDDECS